MVAPHKLQFCKLLGNINAFPSSQSLGWGRSKFRNTHATEIEGQCFVCRGILEHERSGEEKDPFRNLFAINKPWLLLQYFHRKSPQRCVLIAKCQKKICCGMKQKNVFSCLQHGQFWVLGKQRPFSPESDTLGRSAYLGSSMVGMYGGHDQLEYVGTDTDTDVGTCPPCHSEHGGVIQGGLHTIRPPVQKSGLGSQAQ